MVGSSLNELPPLDPEVFKSEEIEKFTIDSVRIDPVNLNEEFCELAPRLAYWNAHLAAATERFMTAKMEYEQEKARKLLEIREESRLDKSKITVDEINARVLLDDEVVDAQIVMVGSDAERIRIKGIVDAIITKREMLQSLGAKLRAEMVGDPVLRSQLAGASGIELER